MKENIVVSHGQCYSITQDDLQNYTINELVDNGYRFTIDDVKEDFDEAELDFD